MAQKYILGNYVSSKPAPSKSCPQTEKALKAMEELSNAASKNGTAEMSLDEINMEIEAARNV